VIKGGRQKFSGQAHTEMDAVSDQRCCKLEGIHIQYSSVPDLDASRERKVKSK